MPISGEFSCDALENAPDLDELEQKLGKELTTWLQSASDKNATIAVIVDDLKRLGHPLERFAKTENRLIYRGHPAEGRTTTVLFALRDNSVRVDFRFRGYTGTKIGDLCDWSEAGERALEDYGVGEFFDTAGLDDVGADLFGSAARVFVHHGDIRVDGGFATFAQGYAVYVIDGSLTVDGPFVFTAGDLHTVLIVTGDLVARELVQAMDSQLGVKGKTVVDGLLWIDVSDAGFSIFRGPVRSRVRYVGFRSGPKFDGGVEGRVLRAPEHATDTVLEAVIDEVALFSA
jgi:hypothetical protein